MERRVAEVTFLGPMVLAADGCSVAKIAAGHYVVQTDNDGDRAAIKCFTGGASRIAGIERRNPREWLVRFINDLGLPADDVGAYISIRRAS